MTEFVRGIIDKLTKDEPLTLKEKACIEKAILMVDYYENLLDQDLGLVNNTSLKFTKDKKANHNNQKKTEVDVNGI